MSDTAPKPPDASSETGRDRRQFQRVRGPFDGTWEGASGNSPARIWDLSIAGCFIDSLSAQRPGEHVRVRITVPEGEVRAEGIVVYCVPNQGFAVQFTEPGDPARDVLARVVDRRMAEGHGT